MFDKLKFPLLIAFHIVFKFSTKKKGISSLKLSEEFKPFFNAYTSKEASIVADEWKGYLPLKKEYPFLRQLPSNKGANFRQLHIHMMNIQGCVYVAPIFILRQFAKNVRGQYDWHNQLRQKVTMRIDEDIFRPLYCQDNGTFTCDKKKVPICY